MITAEQLEDIACALENNGVSEATVALLRNSHNGCHFTYCMDDDIVTGRPVLQRAAFNLYLVDSRDHCSGLTLDGAVASGVVVAEVIAD